MSTAHLVPRWGGDSDGSGSSFATNAWVSLWPWQRSEVWCLYSDRAIATLIRTYFKYARWRRSLRRFAAAATCSPSNCAHMKTQWHATTKCLPNLSEPCCCCCCFSRILDDWVWPHDIGDAKSVAETNLHVAERLGVWLPASPATPEPSMAKNPSSSRAPQKVRWNLKLQ